MTLHILDNLEQGSPEWHDARRGIVTASVVGKLISIGPPAAISVDCPTCDTVAHTPCISTARKLRTEIKTIHEARTSAASDQPPVYQVADNDTSRALTATLVAERISGFTEDTPMTSDMFRGVLSEPFARDAYSEHFAPVEEVGFLRLEEDGWSLGYSPDGLVGDDGLIEVKSPRAKTHLRTILADEVPAFYLPQCQAGLLVSGRKWLDFVSFVGGMPLYVKRVYPDPKWFDAITAACVRFEQEAETLTAAYDQRIAGMPTTERVPTDLELVF